MNTTMKAGFLQKGEFLHRWATQEGRCSKELVFFRLNKFSVHYGYEGKHP